MGCASYSAFRPGPRRDFKRRIFMKKKRILSILLALVLIVSALPMTVFAAGEYSYIFFGGGIHTDDETATETLGGGTATWDAASATLTLDGVTTSDYISLQATDPSTTFTLVLKGTNRVEYAYSGTAIYSNANLNIVAEEGASLYTKSSDANAIYVNGILSFSGGSYELTSAYPPVCADGTVNISGAADGSQ